MMTFFNKFITLFFLSALFCGNSFSQQPTRQLALTIDDLPFVGESKSFHLNMIIDVLKSHEVPATGFIIAGNVTKDVIPTLRKFREAGLGLGNHTFTHLNLNHANTESYLQEIEDADRTLLPLLTEPKYFRYPYLAMSKGDKKDMVLSFLSAKNYQVAPVTIDSKDFIFNQLLLSVPEKERRAFLTVLKPCYLDFIWQQTRLAEEQHRSVSKGNSSQVLLIHANLLNAYVLPDIINLYRQNGFSFVSLDDALKTPGSKSVRLAANSKIEDSGDEFVAWD